MYSNLKHLSAQKLVQHQHWPIILIGSEYELEKQFYNLQTQFLLHTISDGHSFVQQIFLSENVFV